MAKYWFARRFPVSDAKANAVAPVSSEGWMVVTFFGASLLAGATGLATLSFGYREPFLGVIVLIGFALVGTVTFLVSAVKKSDQQHTVDEYKQGRVSAR